jgi:hypothetical protein
MALSAPKDVEEPSSTPNMALARSLDIFLIAGPLVHLWIFTRVNGYSGTGDAFLILISVLPFSILLIARVLLVSVISYVLLIISAGGMAAFDLYVHFSLAHGDGTGWALITVPLFAQLPFAFFVLLIILGIRYVSREA